MNTPTVVSRISFFAATTSRVRRETLARFFLERVRRFWGFFLVERARGAPGGRSQGRKAGRGLPRRPYSKTLRPGRIPTGIDCSGESQARTCPTPWLWPTGYTGPMPIDPLTLSTTLEAESDAEVARRRMKQVRPLKGLRGVASGEVARQAAAAWRQGVNLIEDADALHELFCTAHEDGILAISLVAAGLGEAPEEALSLAERWLEMVDDLETADALGWLVWAPALRAVGEPVGQVLAGTIRSSGKPVVRRTAVMAGLALTPTRVEGPAAAALRELWSGDKRGLSEQPVSRDLEAVAHAALRDTDPHVRRALGRLLRCWASSDPDAVEALLAGVSGGVPKQLRAEAERGVRKGRRGR